MIFTMNLDYIETGFFFVKLYVFLFFLLKIIKKIMNLSKHN